MLTPTMFSRRRKMRVDRLFYRTCPIRVELPCLLQEPQSVTLTNMYILSNNNVTKRNKRTILNNNNVHSKLLIWSVQKTAAGRERQYRTLLNIIITIMLINIINIIMILHLINRINITIIIIIIINIMNIMIITIITIIINTYY